MSGGPLVSDNLLLELYAAAVAIHSSLRPAAARGEAVVRASALRALETGDVLADGSGCFSEAQLGLPELRLLPAGNGRALLALPGSLEEQLLQALGVAVGLKRRGEGRLMLMLVPGGAVRTTQWKTFLPLTAQAEVPLIVLLLPAAASAKAAPGGPISARSQSMGVPGIPVEATDGLALMRVLQESAVRVRAGDGPVLIEAIHSDGGDPRGRARRDPLATLAGALRARGIAVPTGLPRGR